jgi:hypothetical protein
MRAIDRAPTTLAGLALALGVSGGCGSSTGSSSVSDVSDGGTSKPGSSSSGSSSMSGGSTSGSGSGANSGSGGGDASSSGSSAGSGGSSGGGEAGTGAHIKHVFLILMENENWSFIYQSSQAPYINSLLTTASTQTSYATNYYDNPSAVHPSEPNYIWLEGGSNFGFTNDDDPSATHVINKPHLATLLNAAGVSWREYAEDISAKTCPVMSTAQYACKHVPFVFFQDVVGNPPSATSASCVPHFRPFTQLAADLSSGDVAAYNFITPNLCDDMHGNTGCPSTPEITQGDTWLSTNIPVITASDAYKNGGAIFITWDESEGGELPIGMIVVSPFAKGHGYAGTKKYYHSSTLRSMQEIFSVSPFLNDAANQLDLSDLFSEFP